MTQCHIPEDTNPQTVGPLCRFVAKKYFFYLRESRPILKSLVTANVHTAVTRETTDSRKFCRLVLRIVM